MCIGSARDRTDPDGTHKGDDNAPREEVGDPRGKQDVVMADAATESGLVIAPEGRRTDGNLVAPTLPERP